MKAAQRKALAKRGLTAYKDGSYPIHDLAHARNALARAAQKNTKGSYSHVARKVKARYGSKIAVGGSRRKSGSRRRSR